MRLTIALVFLLSISLNAQGQDLTLEDCYERARQNYPLIKQKELIAKSKEFSVDNVKSGLFSSIQPGRSGIVSVRCNTPTRTSRVGGASLERSVQGIFEILISQYLMVEQQKETVLYRKPQRKLRIKK
ncbi:MAG: hypothetical protein U5K54_11655 [Cytophagales bacterium]|nr:hypothetical protein [Cytophagales bacterium]